VTKALRKLLHPGFLPVIAALGIWVLLPSIDHLPPYKLPHLTQVLSNLWQLTRAGTLPRALAASITRLGIAFVVGSVAGVATGLAVALSDHVRAFLMPLIAFFNSIAGIAWIPMAIVWFGLGSGPVLFVIANNIFFIVLYNTIVGAEGVPKVMFDAVRVVGGTRRSVLVKEVLLPGALVGVLGGLRTGLAFGWRALIAVELIAASSGLGYLSIQASRVYDSATVVSVVLVTGLAWLAMDRLLLRPVEARTVERWGMVQSSGQAAL
jgi:ABC-type nitrate/sulfonate/bicarbonate transport system permease component